MHVPEQAFTVAVKVANEVTGPVTFRCVGVTDASVTSVRIHSGQVEEAWLASVTALALDVYFASTVSGYLEPGDEVVTRIQVVSQWSNESYRIADAWRLAVFQVNIEEARLKIRKVRLVNNSTHVTEAFGTALCLRVVVVVRGTNLAVVTSRIVSAVDTNPVI